MAVDISRVERVFQVRDYSGSVLIELGQRMQYSNFDDAVEKVGALNSRSGYGEDYLITEVFLVHHE